MIWNKSIHLTACVLVFPALYAQQTDPANDIVEEPSAEETSSAIDTALNPVGPREAIPGACYTEQLAHTQIVLDELLRVLGQEPGPTEDPFEHRLLAKATATLEAVRQICLRTDCQLDAE